MAGLGPSRRPDRLAVGTRNRRGERVGPVGPVARLAPSSNRVGPTRFPVQASPDGVIWTWITASIAGYPYPLTASTWATVRARPGRCRRDGVGGPGRPRRRVPRLSPSSRPGAPSARSRSRRVGRCHRTVPRRPDAECVGQGVRPVGHDHEREVLRRSSPGGRDRELVGLAREQGRRPVAVDGRGGRAAAEIGPSRA